MRAISIYLIFLIMLSACESNPRNANESSECRQAKGSYQMCFGSCLGSTPGTFLQAASKCGNMCQKEASNMASICR